MNYTLAIVCGRFTSDPVLRRTTAGKPVVTFRLASSRKWGQDREDKLFISCTVFGKSGETLNEHFHRGDPILVQGRLQTDEWETKDGQKRSEIKLMVQEWSFVGGTRDQQESHRSGAAPHKEERFVPDPYIREDEIPF